MHPRLALFAALLALPGSVSADASGTLREVAGVAWPVRDAAAMRTERSIAVMLTTQPIDWIDFAADGKLDGSDFSRHLQGAGALAVVELAFDAKGQFRMGRGYDTEEERNPVGGWKLLAIEDARIAGRFDYAGTEVSFDLEIRPAELKPVGEPLGADAEPVKALVAYFAAMRRQDLEAVLAASFRPEEVAAADDEVRAGFRKALQPSPLSVRGITFVRGSIAGHAAHVEYSTERRIPDRKVHLARLVRVDGRWLVASERVD